MSRQQFSKRPFTVGRALALLPVSLFALMGCGTLIGLDSYTVASGGSGGSGVSGNGAAGGSSSGASAGKTSGGQSSGGQSSGGQSSGGQSSGGEASGGEASGGRASATGGAGTTTGGGGASGVSGSSGVSGTLAQAGEGGEAGANTGPVVPVPLGCDGKTPVTVNSDVVRTCVLRSSCDPYDPVRSISECITNNTPDAFAGEHCHIANCADYEACEHHGIAGDDLCPESKWGTDFCVGTKAVSCTKTGDFSSWVDCIGVGGTDCGTYNDGTGIVSDCKVNQDCTTVDPNTYVCSSETPALTEFECVGGQAYGFDCGSFAFCDASGGDAGCYLTAGKCGADKTSCSTDNVATVCAGGGQYEYNCASVGLACQVGAANSDGDTNYCLAPGCKPADVNNCEESCDGTKLSVCYGGTTVTVDCIDYGFSRCLDQLDNGSNLPSYATCAP